MNRNQAPDDRQRRETGPATAGGVLEKPAARRSWSNPGWRWLTLSGAVAAMALVGAGLLLLWRKAEPPVSPGTAGKKTPPFNVPATPPRQVDPAAFEKQYAKYFTAEFLKTAPARMDKNMDVNALHAVLIRGDARLLGTLFIDKTGTVALAAPYPLVSEFSEDLALVGTKISGLPDSRISHYGFIDRTGQLVIAAEFELAMSFREGMAGVQKGGKWGFIDRQGEVVIPHRYLRVEEFRDGVARAWPDHDTVEFIDPKGRVLFKGDRWSGTFSDGLVHLNISIPGRPLQRGYFDRQFKLVIRFDPDGKSLWPARAEEFHEGRAAVEIGSNTWGFIDQNGTLVIPASFRQVASFSEGLACVSLGLGATSPRGYIDRSGKMAIEPRFLSAGSFKEGLAPVLIPLDDKNDPAPAEKLQAIPRGKWGYIDKTGRVVIEPRFYTAGSFRADLARVSENPYHVGFIDRTGAYVFQVHEPTGVAGE